MSVPRERLLSLRAALMGDARMRAGSEAVVEGMLASLAEVDDDESAEPWLIAFAAGEPSPEFEISVGELRERLRGTLAELAYHDRP